MFILSCVAHGELGRFSDVAGARGVVCSPCVEVARREAQDIAAAAAIVENLQPVATLKKIGEALEAATVRVKEGHHIEREDNGEDNLEG